MSESLVTQNVPRRNRTVLRFVAIVAIVLIAACALCAIPVVGAVGSLLESVFSQASDDPGIGDFFNGEMTDLLAELNADDRITGFEVNLEWNTDPEYGQGEGWYLTIDVSTPLTCSSGASDPCAKLVDDAARMVFRNYRKVDRLAGLTVMITQNSETSMAKSLSIPGWRRTLEIDDDTVSQ